jgi:hypothetical protein
MMGAKPRHHSSERWISRLTSSGRLSLVLDSPSCDEPRNATRDLQGDTR